MKKLLLLIIAMLLFVSCRGTVLESPDISREPFVIPTSSTAPTQTPEVSISDTELIINFYDYSERSDENKESLTGAIKDKYDVQIRLHKITPETFTDEKQSPDGIIKIGSYISAGLYQNRWSLFQPMNDYLNDNEIYQSLPTAVKISMKDNLGLIWGWPANYDFRFGIRVYSDVVMEKTGCDVPNTIDELTEYFEKAKVVMESGSTIMKTNPTSCLYNLLDIAYAFGLKAQSGSTIIYDKYSQSYKDSVYDADIIGFLGYVSFLKDNDYLIFEEERSTTGYEDAILLAEGKVGSYTTGISSGGAPSKYYSYGLTGDSLNKIPIGFNSTDMIYLWKDTVNPSEVINTYINTFYSSNEANILGFYGESGYRVEYTDDSLIRMMALDYEQIVLDVMEGKMLYSAGLCGYGFYNDYFRFSSMLEEDSLLVRRTTYSEYLDFRNKGFEDNKFDLLPPNKMISDLDRVNHRDKLYTFRDMLAKYLRQEVSINDFMAEYEKLNGNSGQKDYIELLNDGS